MREQLKLVQTELEELGIYGPFDKGMLGSDRKLNTNPVNAQYGNKP